MKTDVKPVAENAVELAVVAAVRHQDTGYDDLLMSGIDRETARAEVRTQVSRIVDGWRRPSESDVPDSSGT